MSPDRPRLYRGRPARPKAAADRPGRTGDPLVAVGYIRVSKDEQDLSPEAQLEAMEGWCRGRGVVLASWHEDRLCSVTAVDQRPGLMEAIEQVQALGAGVLLVAKRDRLARDPIITAMVERLAERAGARVQSAAGEGTDGDGPVDQLMRRIVDAFAEYERALIRQRTKAALAVKSRRGERVGKVPYGWRVGADGVHLEPDAVEQHVIRTASGLRDQGLSLSQVSQELAQMNLFSRRGLAFQRTSILRMVSGRRLVQADLS